jgi:hypothetical protein
MSVAATFDATYYLTNNADVVVAISQGNFGSALDHYTQFGGKELRQPNSTFNPTYYAINNTDVLNATSTGGLSSVFAHYQEFGEAEGRAPSTNFASFTSAAYLTANPDVATAITAGSFTSALDHYISFGQTEARSGSGISSTVTTNPGSTFTLTVGSDSGADFLGSTGDDTYVGLIDDNTSANNTFGTLDVLDGGDGTDTFSITADTSAAGLAMPAATVSNIENYLIRNASGQTLTFNTALVTGEQIITSDRSANALTLTNVAAGTTLEQRGNEVTTNGALTAGYVAAATAGTLNITNGTTAGAIAVNGAGLTDLTINSTGANNTVGALSSTGDPTTVTINAATNLTATSLAVASNSGAQSLAITGAGNVSIGTFDTDFATITTTGFTGGLTATLSGTAGTALTGGAGSDVITTSGTGQTGTVSGGDGTDTLALATSAAIDTTAEGAVYTNFETLRVANNASIDMDLMTGSTITAIQLTDGAAATAITDMNATQAANVTVRAINDTATFSVKNASVVGSNDVISITASDGDAIANEDLTGGIAANGADYTIAGVETITIVATDQFDADALNNITGMTRLNVEGAGTVNIITGAVAMGTNGFINAADATGAVTIVAAALATNAFAYTGGSGVDTFTDGAIGGNQINTGAGNDIITLTDKTGGTATTVVTGGAGQDDVIANMTGNVNRDVMKFNFAAGDSISDSSTTGISTTLTDTINNLDGAALNTTAGSKVEFDTEVQATAVTAGSTDVSLGTTTVTNGGDFYVDIASATVVNIYQDTDGDNIIEAGEFAIQLTGIQTGTVAAGEFAIVAGDLVLTTA